MCAQKCWAGILSQSARKPCFRSSSYVSGGALIKNIARHHSYFMGHSQNELSAARGGPHVCTPRSAPSRAESHDSRVTPAVTMNHTVCAESC